MSLEELRITSDAHFVCLTHVLSTETSEVMGLLFGDVEDGTCRVLSVRILARLDKRPDRVEISPDQLLAATEEAERLSDQLGRPVRVVGWYHSHPHITVWPSAVDLRTQETYQTMESRFAGLIFSVYPERGSAGVQLTCFQSERDKTGQLQRRAVPVTVEPGYTVSSHCLTELCRLPEVLREEELRSYDQAQEEVSAASGGDWLTDTHNRAVLVRNTTQTLGLLTLPLVQLMETRLVANQRRLRQLLDERDALLARLVKKEAGDADSRRASPRKRRVSGADSAASPAKSGRPVRRVKQEPATADTESLPPSQQKNRPDAERTSQLLSPVKQEPADSTADSTAQTVPLSRGRVKAEPSDPTEVSRPRRRVKQEPPDGAAEPRPTRRRRLKVEPDSDSSTETLPRGSPVPSVEDGRRRCRPE